MTSGWMGAQGNENGRPVLVRVRECQAVDDLSRRFPHLVVVRWHYRPSDGSGLPSEDQYTLIDSFERRVADGIERDALGVLTVVRTHNGTMQSEFYVADSNKATDYVDAHAPSAMQIEFSVAENEGWKRYERILKQIR